MFYIAFIWKTYVLVVLCCNNYFLWVLFLHNSSHCIHYSRKKICFILWILWISYLQGRHTLFQINISTENYLFKIYVSIFIAWDKAIHCVIMTNYQGTFLSATSQHKILIAGAYSFYAVTSNFLCNYCIK